MKKYLIFIFCVLALHFEFISVKSQMLYCQNSTISISSACLFFDLASVFTALGCWVTQSAVDSSMSLEELLSRYNYLSIDRFQIKVYRTALKSTLYSTIWQISTIWRGLNFCSDMFNESLISFVLTT